MILELIGQVLVEQQYLKTQAFDAFTMITVTLMALMFCLSSVLFISWVCKTVKKHEYHELLLVKWIMDPTRFRAGNPSNTFIQRWNRNQNRVGFFLVLTVPMTVSPAIAIYHIYGVIAEGGDFVFMIQVWSAVIFALAAVFHLWGTQLLIDMYNGHLRIEAVNQQHLRGGNPWLTQGSRSVLGDYHEKEEREKPGDLVPLRTLAAIMITDIVGFSRDMEKDETRTYAKLMSHNKTVRSVISGHRGDEIKTMGDAFLVRFKSAVDAVKAGVAIQTEFREYNAERPEEDRILVRIGIHIGDILIMDRDVLGNGVNIAARIEPLAEPGGICISADVYNVVKKVIALNVVNIGRKELKNIADAPEIFRVLIDEEA
jgi:class 3 adenylate cyclase